MSRLQELCYATTVCLNLPIDLLFISDRVAQPTVQQRLNGAALPETLEVLPNIRVAVGRKGYRAHERSTGRQGPRAPFRECLSKHIRYNSQMARRENDQEQVFEKELGLCCLDRTTQFHCHG
jgi:hypothetical protein